MPRSCSSIRRVFLSGRVTNLSSSLAKRRIVAPATKADGNVENQNQVSHFPIASVPLSQNKTAEWAGFTLDLRRRATGWEHSLGKPLVLPYPGTPIPILVIQIAVIVRYKDGDPVQCWLVDCTGRCGETVPGCAGRSPLVLPHPCTPIPILVIKWSFTSVIKTEIRSNVGW